MPSRSDEDADEILLKGVARRDADALMALYRKYGTRVFSLVCRITGDRASAEEVLQDTFHRLWQKPHLYDPVKGPLLAWLFTVGRNAALDQIRKENRRASFRVLQDEGTIGSELPAKQVEAADPTLEHAIRQALESLPTNQRRLIELTYFEGWTHTELATHFAEPVGTVKTRIRLGMSKLRETLRKYHMVIFL